MFPGSGGYIHAAEEQLYSELSVSLGIAREKVRPYIQERVRKLEKA